MADNDPKMVLRTVYLPPDLDEKLRVRAFRANVTKGDLIRQGLALVLEDAEPVAAANLGRTPKTPDRLRSQYVANWVKIAGDAASGKTKIMADERRELVKAAEKILAAARKSEAAKPAVKPTKAATAMAVKPRANAAPQGRKPRARAENAKGAVLGG